MCYGCSVCVYIYIGWVQIAHRVILNNVTLLNNFLLHSYIENLITELHDLYVLNMHANFILIRCNLPFDL